MQKCYACQQIKTIDDFELTSNRGEYFRRKTCKLCVCERRRKKYHANIKETRQKRNDYYALVGRHKYRENYHKNECAIKEQRKRNRSSPKGRAYQMWRNAKSRGGPDFNVDRKRITDIVERGFCERSGVPFDFTTPIGKKLNGFAPSIDRVDRAKGYRDDNVQIVAWCYNSGKGELNDEDFIAFCKAVAEYNK